MADTLALVTASNLWKLLSQDRCLSQAVLDLRVLAEAIGKEAARVVPDYTDHSVKHMDALWRVCDQVFTQDEIARFSLGEAFILGCSFYVHDLGMALSATTEGLNRVQGSHEYKVAVERLRRVKGMIEVRASVLAVRLASRDIHAHAARDLVKDPLPGLNRYLIENTEIREAWGTLIADVAESHHWSLAEVHAKLGRRNRIPAVSGDPIDLGVVACAIRLVDYAHINRERASNLDRALRSEIGVDSVVHWDAQANIAGPDRQGDLLVYGTNAPIEDIDAWWLFYDLARGLDAEIRAVKDYLDERAVSSGRFSLKGVKGVSSAEAFAELVQLAGNIAPIDVRIMPDSMDRLVEMLGGKALYGQDQLAPLRELLQNARDAVELRQTADDSNSGSPPPARIDVSLTTDNEGTWLSVRDNGVGMTRTILTKHLIGVASDFWHSAEFYRDYGSSIERGFKPIGRFGIGFLSVFMLGQQIEVDTEGRSGRFVLRLRGVGRRGDLSNKSTTGNRGTCVRVLLNRSAADLLASLPDVVRARTPMLNVPVVVTWSEDSTLRELRIEPGWWRHIKEDALAAFIRDWQQVAWNGRRSGEADRGRVVRGFRSSRGLKEHDIIGWPGQKPSLSSEKSRVFSSGGNGESLLLRCSRGVAVDVLRTDDLCGIIDVGELDLTASREGVVGEYGFVHRHISNRAVPGSAMEVEEELRRLIHPDIIAKTNELEQHGMLPGRMAFIRWLSLVYGIDVLTTTSLRWIPVLEPPGDSIHRSPEAVINKLQKQSSVLCGIGIPPRAAYALASRKVGREAAGRLVLLALPIDEFEVGYSRASEIEREVGRQEVTGTIKEVVARGNVAEADLVILRSLLALVAKAWNVREQDIMSQEWVLDARRNMLWAVLMRP